MRKSSYLSLKRKEEIGQLITEDFILKWFRLEDAPSELRYRLHNLDLHTNEQVDIEELQTYLKCKLPKMLAEMFGYRYCDITFKNDVSDERTYSWPINH